MEPISFRLDDQGHDDDEEKTALLQEDVASSAAASPIDSPFIISTIHFPSDDRDPDAFY